MGSLVLVHKVPALWEIGAKRNNSDIQFSPDFAELSNLTESENNFLASLKNDIFYILSRTIADYLGLEEIHVILCYDKNEIRNWDVIERNGMITASGPTKWRWPRTTSSLLRRFTCSSRALCRGPRKQSYDLLLCEHKDRGSEEGIHAPSRENSIAL